VAPPVFDHNLQCVEDFAVEQFIAQFFRYAYRTDRIRNLPALRHQHIDLPKLFATISSAVCLFLAINLILHGQNHTSGRTTSKGADHRLQRQLKILREAQKFLILIKKHEVEAANRSFTVLALPPKIDDESYVDQVRRSSCRCTN
jgi:hypothetical protein